tara:strand:- start:193 stop:738 length:546 start_codon:yes stop_codon:yes gene_type:complete
MQSQKEESFFNITQKTILFLVLVSITVSLFIFRNLFFQPTLLLKSFGELSIDPEIALKNNKPTFLEFYAEWCEVCKEMAPKVSALKENYENDINFVFLNVDNPKWEDYIRKFNVNGIPHVNLLSNNGNLEATFIGKQDEEIIKQSLDNLKSGLRSNKEILNSDTSLIKENRIYQISPRSHS